MTSRIFLTLLAILTGFAVQNEPAEARVLRVSSAEIGSVNVASVARNAGISAVSCGLAFQTERPGAANFSPVVLPVSVHRAPSVLVRVDRARE